MIAYYQLIHAAQDLSFAALVGIGSHPLLAIAAFWACVIPAFGVFEQEVLP